MSTYWFKGKKYGWGFVPISWQGWVCSFILSGLLCIAFFIDVFQGFVMSTRIEDWLRYVIDVALLVGIGMLVFNGKSENPLRWRWGND